MGKTWKNRRETGPAKKVRSKRKFGRRPRKRQGFSVPAVEELNCWFHEGELFVDLHGVTMTVFPLILNNAEALAVREGFDAIVFVHGYRGGVRLKDEVREHYGKENCEPVWNNPGATRVYWKGKV